MREHLEADVADVAGRLRVAFPVPLEPGQGGGHVRAQLALHAGRVGGVVGEKHGDLDVLELALGTLVGLLDQQVLRLIHKI